MILFITPVAKIVVFKKKKRRKKKKKCAQEIVMRILMFYDLPLRRCTNT